MSDRRQRRLLCVGQIFKCYLVGSCNYSAFFRACTKSNKHILHAGPDRQLLIKLGGLNICASNTSPRHPISLLQSHATAQTSFRGASSFQDSQGQCRQSDGAALPDHVLAPCTQPNTVPEELQMFMPFPTTLPVFALPPNHNRRYGLLAKQKKHLTSRAPLSQQLSALKNWCTNAFQLDRPSAAYSIK